MNKIVNGADEAIHDINRWSHYNVGWIWTHAVFLKIVLMP